MSWTRIVGARTRAWVTRPAVLGACVAAVLFTTASAASAADPTMYWGHSPALSGPWSIGSSSIFGDGANSSLINGPGENGMTVAGQYLYVSDDFNGTITRYGLDGSDPVQFGTDGTIPYAVAVSGHYLYWTNYGDDDQQGEDTASIGRMNLDGSDVQPNFVSSAYTFAPTSIAINGTHIWWINSGTNYACGCGTPVTGPMSIGRANIDGSDPTENAETFGSNGDQFVISLSGLAVTNDTLFWSEDQYDNDVITDGHVMQAPTDGTAPGTELLNFDHAGLDAGDDVSDLAVEGSTLFYGYTDYPNNSNAGNVGEHGIGNSFSTYSVLFPSPGNVDSLAVDEPQITIRGTSDYGTVSPDGFADATETVTNTGTAPLQISNIGKAGATQDAFQITSDGCENAIPAGGSCQIGVRFVPGGDGLRSAELDFVSDDYADSPTPVYLRGFGGTPPPPPPPAPGGGTGGTGTGTTPTPGTGTSGGTGSSGTGSSGSSGSTGTPPQAQTLPTVRSVTLSGGDDVKVALVCATTGICPAETITETVIEKFRDGRPITTDVARKAGGANKVTTRQVTIAKAQVTTSPGGTRTVTLKLNAIGRKLLAQDHKLTATLTVSVPGKVVKRTKVHLATPKSAANEPK